MKNRSMQDSRIVKPRVTKTKLPSETSNSLSQETGFQRESSEDLENPAFFINRELSWLKFNERVLLQALDPKNPLLERVKFLSIVATNLDEFFMVRVATLLRKYRAESDDISPDGLDTAEQLEAIRKETARMTLNMSDCWAKVLQPLLAENKIRFLEPENYTVNVRDYLRSYFHENIHPVLTPLAVDPGHPFPFVSNLSMNLAVILQHDGRTRLARVKLPDLLPRFISIPQEISGQPGKTFVFLEDVTKENIESLFPGAQVDGSYLFRVVRDTDMVIQEDEADDLLESVDRTLKELRYGALSQLVVESRIPARLLNILLENFEIEEDIVEYTSSRMGYGDWLDLTHLHNPKLKDQPFSARSLWSEKNLDVIFDDIAEKDRLLHHPYDSFASVETFLNAAVNDSQVVAIKMTLYRIGSNSPLVDLLIAAAEAGKQVAVLVELKARFDERNNIAWANRMESTGIHVVYGVVKLKTHCKLCLVVRQTSTGITRFAHIGTGNYNRSTAQVYTDFGLFTSRPSVVDEVSEVFNYLTGYSNKRNYNNLLVAPLNFREEFTALIKKETEYARRGQFARIIIKNNSIADPAIIRSLYRASTAGVQIQMIVRGVCCLRPSIPGISDNIKVQSIVGRFLEHSRLYYFENNGDSKLLLGSADLMERNLDRRVEVLCLVQDKELQEHLLGVLELLLSDNVRTTELHSDGIYSAVDKHLEVSSFDVQKELLNRSGNTQ